VKDRAGVVSGLTARDTGDDREVAELVAQHIKSRD
jgi:hypothetical protein